VRTQFHPERLNHGYPPTPGPESRLSPS